jgi:exonuclease III
MVEVSTHLNFYLSRKVNDFNIVNLIYNMLKIITYNIWFSLQCAEERTDSLCNIINKKDPHVVCLQEARPEILTLLKDKLTNYCCLTDSISPLLYDCCIFIKKCDDIVIDYSDCHVLPFEFSIMMRRLHIANIIYKSKKICIANSHFESIFDPKDTRIELKRTQYMHANNIMSKFFKEKDMYVICADFNMTKFDETSYNSAFAEWNDSWRCGDGFTYDTESNTFLQKKFKYTIQSRIDRILYKSIHDVKTSCFLLGSSILNSNLIEPSDHYGVESIFSS